MTTAGSSANFDVTINKSARNQTIDGFGFFGAQNTWWSGASSLWSDAWGDQVISDLGITIWRNEHYPPSDNLNQQDANWTKQRPVVQGLKRKADQYGVRPQVHLHGMEPAGVDEGARDQQHARDRRAPPLRHQAGRRARSDASYGEFAAWMGTGSRTTAPKASSPTR